MKRSLDAYTPEVKIHIPTNFERYTDLDRRIMANDFLNPGFGVNPIVDSMVEHDQIDAHIMSVYDRSLEGGIEDDEPVFMVDGERYTLTEMLSANCDDEAFCEWARAAKVGDAFPAFVSCVRVS